MPIINLRHKYQIRYKYYKGFVRIYIDCYKEGGRYAIVLEDKHGERIAVASVNLPEYQFIGDNNVFLKGWSENEGLPEALEKLGVVKLSGRKVPTGFCFAQEAKIQI